MPRTITASVGQGGANRKDDSINIQELLNKVPFDRGGPSPLLDVDGLPWQKTIAAIKSFQRINVALPNPDGRVDPNGPTLAALNSFDEPPLVVAESLPPGRAWFL